MTSVLHPYISLKRTGVRWPGDVPNHWHVRRLRTVAEMRVSNVDKHTKEEELPVRLCNYYRFNLILMDRYVGVYCGRPEWRTASL